MLNLKCKNKLTLIKTPTNWNVFCVVKLFSYVNVIKYNETNPFFLLLKSPRYYVMCDESERAKGHQRGQHRFL